MSVWGNVMTRDVVNDVEPGLLRSLKGSMKYYWRVLGLTIITGFIFMVVLLIFIIPMIPIILYGINKNSISTVLLLFLLIFAAAIIVIFLAVCLSPVQSVLIYDNSDIWPSLKKGFEFGFKKFFYILGITALFGAIGVGLGTSLELVSKFTNIYAFSLIPAALSGYIGMFSNIYIMNLYRQYSNAQLDAEIIPGDTSSDTRNSEGNESEDNDNASEDMFKEEDSDDKSSTTDNGIDRNKFTL
jgi:hypothetical protein